MCQGLSWVIPWPLLAILTSFGKIGMLTGTLYIFKERSSRSGRLGHCTWNNTFFLPGRGKAAPLICRCELFTVSSDLLSWRLSFLRGLVRMNPSSDVLESNIFKGIQETRDRMDQLAKLDGARMLCRILSGEVKYFDIYYVYNYCWQRSGHCLSMYLFVAVLGLCRCVGFLQLQ